MKRKVSAVALILGGMAAGLMIGPGQGASAVGPTTTPVRPHGPVRSTPPAKVAHRCVVEVKLFEDGSWAGGRLIYDGKTIYKRWDNHMPKTGWLPGWKGTPCTFKTDVPTVPVK